VVPPPPIQGIGNAAGATMQIELRDSSFDLAKLQATMDALVANAASQSSLQRVQTTFRSGVPQYILQVDRVKAETLHVTLDQVFSALSGYVGSSYVDQFNKFGRTFQIYLQADSQFRLRREDIDNLTVRSQDGHIVPLGTLVTITPTVGPSLISLYNLYPSATVIAVPSSDTSTGEAIGLMEEIAGKTLPPGTAFEWTGMSYQEKIVGNQMYFVFAMALLLVYLVLAGQYESWLTPIAVILAVPLSVLGPVAVLNGLKIANNL
jgi:HAE1 family hydrophobic/amphiphilic exporter-1